jgi:hypothetical protein
MYLQYRAQFVLYDEAVAHPFRAECLNLGTLKLYDKPAVERPGGQLTITIAA